MEPDETIPRDELYSSSEARAILGIGTSSFKNLVDKGEIRKVIPPGKTQGLYRKDDVDRIAEARRQFANTTIIKKRSPKAKTEVAIGETDWVQTSDLPYLLAYDLEMYGIEHTVDISITHAWWKKNPHMCRILYDKSDRRNIWGGITIIPMAEATIFQLLKGEKSERDITPEEILAYEQGQHYYGYVASATIKPEHKSHLRSLIQDMLQYWCEHYPQTQLIKLYAFVSSDEGWDLVSHLFFAPRYDLGPNAFELDPYRRNPSRLIKSFQECLQHKKG